MRSQNVLSYQLFNFSHHPLISSILTRFISLVSHQFSHHLFNWCLINSHIISLVLINSHIISLVSHQFSHHLLGVSSILASSPWCHQFLHHLLGVINSPIISLVSHQFLHQFSTPQTCFIFQDSTVLSTNQLTYGFKR